MRVRPRIQKNLYGRYALGGGMNFLSVMESGRRLRHIIRFSLLSSEVI